jgi:hypothetical protein
MEGQAKRLHPTPAMVFPYDSTCASQRGADYEPSLLEPEFAHERGSKRCNTMSI